MNYIKALIDGRTPLNLINALDVENTIYCAPFEESLFNIASIVTKDGEFVHKFISESTGNYLITDVTVGDEIHKNVRFKLVELNEKELIPSTINLANLNYTRAETNPTTSPVLLHEEALEEVSLPPRSTPISVDQIQYIRKLEGKLKNQALQLEAFKANESVEKIILDYKTELLNEHYALLSDLETHRDRLKLEFDETNSITVQSFINKQSDILTKKLQKINEKTQKILEEKKSIDQILKENHINWLSKYGPSGRTYFRSAIKEGFITSPVFKVIKRLHCDQQEIEILERDLIQLLRPRFNIDLDPVASSKEYKRY